MNKQFRIIIFGIYVSVGLLSETYILWLFPFTGLGGLICWPTTIICSLLLGYILSRVTKRKFRNWQVAILFLVLLSLQFIVQLWTVPQDFGGNAFARIADSKRAYGRYDKIKFTDFSSLTAAERVVYIYKFRNQLPNKFIELKIDSLKDGWESMRPRTYLIQEFAGKRVYDKSKIEILESSTATIISEYYKGSDTLTYKMGRNFLNNTDGGYSNQIVSLYVHEDTFKLDSGIEKLLYRLLSWTKNAYR